MKVQLVGVSPANSSSHANEKEKKLKTLVQLLAEPKPPKQPHLVTSEAGGLDGAR